MPTRSLASALTTPQWYLSRTTLLMPSSSLDPSNVGGWRPRRKIYRADVRIWRRVAENPVYRLFPMLPGCDPMRGGEWGDQLCADFVQIARFCSTFSFPGRSHDGGQIVSGTPVPVPVIGFGRLLMRPLLIGVAGGAVGLVAFGFSRVDGELLSAVFFVLALYMIPLTSGIVIAVIFEAWQQAPPGRRRFPAAVGTRGRCGLCRRKMTQVGFVRVCPVCDGVATER